MYCSQWSGSGKDGGLRVLALADSPYLVAMALIDQQGRRALPLLIDQSHGHEIRRVSQHQNPKVTILTGPPP